jgi:single-strand DNA-binding protein
MSTGVNQVTLVGYLAADPELRYTKAGKAVVSFRVACTISNYNSTTKERKEFTEFISCVAWFSAEYVGKNARKGTLVHVFGRLTTRSWETKSGEKRYTTEVNCEQVNLLARYGSDTDNQHQQAKRDGYQPSPPQTPPGDDDIPF